MSTRKYSSPQREELARLTRRRILAAAEQELRGEGYHAMTVAALARRAEVSPQTIYNAIGSKAAVIKALYDVLLAGDDEPIPMSSRPEFVSLQQQPDSASTLRAYLGLGMRLHGRVGDLLGAVVRDGPGTDQELKDFVATIEKERRIGCETVIRHIVQRFGPLPGISADRAADVLWTATSFELADRLLRSCGWSPEEFRAWLEIVVVETICPDSEPAGSR